MWSLCEDDWNISIKTLCITAETDKHVIKSLLDIFTYPVCGSLHLTGCVGTFLSSWCVIGSGGSAAESWEQAEADEPGAGGAPQKLAWGWPQKPRVGGVPT